MMNPVFARIALAECLRDAMRALHPGASRGEHLDAAMHWLALAQDQAGNGGVSAGFGRRGWRPDYPETTGYIIPTFIEHARTGGGEAFLHRARRMGEYELGVQGEGGWIPGGYAHPRFPCVFDTGQVIFGWLALHRETGQPEYLVAARRAGTWLLSVQAGDGSWPTHDHAGSARAYHARVAWALIELGLATSESRFAAAARAQLDWVLGRQHDNGWFGRAELRGQPFPVTHTIAYTVRGLLESGAALREERYLAAARKTADALERHRWSDGSLSGAFDAAWRPQVGWRCLTGCAQVSIVWLRLYELGADARYLAAAQHANTFLCRTQTLGTRTAVRGAIKGSWPFYGRYERFSYPNWATKFFADALMLERRLVG
jgi:uncharacterized protein YyaL (SSP411 family)